MQRFRILLSLCTSLFLDFVFPKAPQTEILETVTPENFLHLLGNPEPTHEIREMCVGYDFKSPHTKHVIHEIKFNGNKILAQKIGFLFYEKILEELSNKILFEHFKDALLIPIPISKKRLKERGFNQCELICKALEKCDKEKHFTLQTDILEKQKEVESQVGKTREERLINLKNCFKIKDNISIKGKNIILFDDVVTTSATMHEAERTLKKGGAKKVWCVALAH